MKQFTFHFLSTLLCVTLFVQSYSQNLTQLPGGGNKKAWVGERVGLTDITIRYDRPAVKGRQGKIWGQLVHAGYVDQGFGNSKAAPWRAGANENTVIEFSSDVKIEGQPLKAGKYGLFIAYDSMQPTVIFSNNSSSWGSYYYSEKEDALRVKVKTIAAPVSKEWLEYEFDNQTENTATINLHWEKLMIPFKVEVDYVKDQLESFKNELRTQKGFTWMSWNEATQWALQRNVGLEEALLWSDSATSQTFGGNNQFQTWSTKGQLLAKMGKTTEADAAMKTAMPLASMTEMHQYARQLLQQKRNAEALEIFKLNASKNPNQFTTLMGLVRGYSANADYKNALKYAKLALPLSPNVANTTFLNTAIKTLGEGKDIN